MSLQSIYARIRREIPEKWFDPSKLKQDGIPLTYRSPDGTYTTEPDGGNPSIVGSILWISAKAIARLEEGVDFLYTRLSLAKCSGTDLDLQYGARYGIQREPQETDNQYRARVIAAMMAERKTRRAILNAVERVLGKRPIDMIEASAESFFLDTCFLDVHHVMRASLVTTAADNPRTVPGRTGWLSRDTLLLIPGPLTDDTRRALKAALRGIMPGINLAIEEITDA